jgi:hypothetical protein
MHRHPQHDNFLSSIDVHQLYVNMQQNTLNVSVVYSPISENQWQAYTLTDYGRLFVSKCTQSGFHTHEAATQKVYEAASFVQWCGHGQVEAANKM